MRKIVDRINKNKISIWVIGVLLFILPLLRINMGVDITDTGYSLGNFENFTSMDGMWVLATYLSNVIGYFFTLLPFGHTMIGMNFYTSLVVSFILLFSFFTLRKVLPRYVVFVGEILAYSLCWCPTAILYNYLTYLAMILVIYFIYKGLLKDNNKFLVLAGILLGCNVFVRFPNLVEIGFIVIVWYDAILQKKGWRKGIYDTFSCVFGYIVGFGSMLLVVLIQYGFDQYKGMINSLRGIGSSIQGYGPMTMVTRVLAEYWNHINWIWIAILCIVVFQVLYSVLKNKIARILICVFGEATFGIVFLHYYRNGLFTKTSYNGYQSMFFWAMLFLFLSITMAMLLLLKKDVDRKIKLLAVISLLIILITPLGSNNMVFPNFNNLFLVAPVTFYALYEYFLKKSLRTKLLPTQLMLFVLLMVIMIQCFMFKTVFTFRDEGYPKGLTTTVANNDVLRGMKTHGSRADILEDLSLFVEENGLQDRTVIMFGNTPAIPYFLRLKPEITSTWPDLPSYSTEEFAYSLKQAEKPLVIIATDGYPNITADVQVNEKATLVSTFIKERQYQVIHKNSMFEIYDVR